MTALLGFLLCKLINITEETKVAKMFGIYISQSDLKFPLMLGRTRGMIVVLLPISVSGGLNENVIT